MARDAQLGTEQTVWRGWVGNWRLRKGRVLRKPLPNVGA